LVDAEDESSLSDGGTVFYMPRAQRRGRFQLRAGRRMGLSLGRPAAVFSQQDLTYAQQNHPWLQSETYGLLLARDVQSANGVFMATLLSRQTITS